ncbi:MAG: hypothetical protein ABJ215_10230 [Alphaproteobacteria bacterium]
MHAQKFQIRYSPVQDRVLIIVTGEDAQERVFGLTRRIVKRLVPGLRGIMGNDTFTRLTPTLPFDPPSPAQGPTTGSGAQPGETTAAATATASQATGDGTSDSTSGPASNPAAPQPDTHLVTRLRIVEKSKGTHVLQISDTATTLNVPLNGDQIVQFTQGILTVLERSEWALEWDAEMAEPQSGSTAPEAAGDTGAIDITADSPSRYRH